MYDKAVKGIMGKLIYMSEPNFLTYVAGKSSLFLIQAPFTNDVPMTIPPSLWKHTSKFSLLFNVELSQNHVIHKMDHLSCFLGGTDFPWTISPYSDYDLSLKILLLCHPFICVGTLALGAYTHPDSLNSTEAQRQLKVGKQLAYTCYQM